MLTPSISEQERMLAQQRQQQSETGTSAGMSGNMSDDEDESPHSPTESSAASSSASAFERSLSSSHQPTSASSNPPPSVRDARVLTQARGMNLTDPRFKSHGPASASLNARPLDPSDVDDDDGFADF
jgi:hypothetical protein